METLHQLFLLGFSLVIAKLALQNLMVNIIIDLNGSILVLAISTQVLWYALAGYYSANPHNEAPLTAMQGALFFFVVFVADFQRLSNTTFFLKMTAIMP